MAKKVKVRPLGDKVLIEPLSEETATRAGIIIPDTVDKEKSERGRVVEVGPGRVTDDGRLIEPQVKKGQVVIFSKYGPDEIKVGDKEYYILSESSILAILEE